ncbi:MAG: HAMP domain-containing histidine kinase [Abditibacteriota bacterium]|nr:HAMP domain-containing histidine kinase [Abditibacteriota bacterium]
MKRAEHNTLLDWVLHEMAGPLTAIGGYADIALEKDASPEEKDEAVRVIRQEASRLLRLTGEIRSMARLSKGQPIGAELSEFDLREVCGHAVSVHRVAWPGHELAVDTPAAVTVRADRDKLCQALLNLLANSAKYSPRGSEITVTCGREQDCGFVTVTDRGSGIAPEDLEKIFALGERLDAPLHTDGRGIGLFLTRELLSAMGGSIRVESRVGEGSRFTLLVPLA